ncbi:hypothetical protein AURDEDRAFT_63863, partial [Auricularia subglabra TFB-10046 SS5]
MESAFEGRLHGPAVPPQQFDTSWRDKIAGLVSELPDVTEDSSADGIWSRDFTVPEIAAGKEALLAHLDSSPGIDSMAYSEVLRIPNDRIATLLSRCLREPLECCLLKLMTLLLDKRLREYLDRENLLPRTQNGFRPQFRTENNPFILRAAIEQAWSNKKPLYVAFVDLRNAFPSVNHDILWHKLRNLGVSGPVFD